MDLHRSEDQELFRETTRRFLESTCPVPTVREWAEKEPDGYPAEWWRRGAELGWTSLLVSEDDGGGSISGHGLLDLVLVAEEMGRLVSPGPLVPTNVVAAALSASGSGRHAEVLADLLSGEAVAAWCLAEAGAWSADGVTLSAVAADGGFVLDGTKGPVEAAAAADHLLVAARVDGELTQFLVPRAASGVTVTPLESIDLVRRTATVEFDSVAVGDSSVVGEVGGAAADIERQLQLAVVLQCAHMVGALDTMFNLTLEYSFDRYTFGRPLASYQALKHRFADLKLWLEACHATAGGAARAVDAATERAFELVSVAKSYIGDRGPAILQDCVQLHGGIGVTWDHDLHLYLRRVVYDRAMHGTPADHRERVAARGRTLGVDMAERTETEDVETFRLRARAWLAEHMPHLPEGVENHQLMVEDEYATRARELQRTLFDGGFAGLCFPVEYGGQGLSRAHQQAFTQESIPYEMPVVFNTPTLSILAPTLLDFGTEEQKLRHLPRIISGEELWVQFLSEPSGGSDLAGLVTRATRDGDVFLLNGSKIWSSGAFRADYALCLARTNWHVPKHRGITCFIVKIHQPGIEVQQIKMVNGWNEFCQEFFDDVAVPVDAVVGEIDDGWTVATRLLVHERNAVGGASPYTSGLAAARSGRGIGRNLVDVARSCGLADDPRVRQLVGEGRVNDRVAQQLVERVTSGIASGHFSAPAGSLPRLFGATASERSVDIALEIIGRRAAGWSEGDLAGDVAVTFLMRQGGSLGGGSNEMQRNIISERLLGMPREYAADKDRPFDEVLHNAAPSRPGGAGG